MLIILSVALILATAIYFILRHRGPVWSARVTLAVITGIAWFLAFATYALAANSSTGLDDNLSYFTLVLVALYVAYPLVLWMAATAFGRGRNA